MREGENIPGRLEALLDSIFAPHPDPYSLYWEIAAEMRPEDHARSQRRVRRGLRRAQALTTDSALLAACVLQLTGFPIERILDFLSLRLATTVSLPQFDLVMAAFFMGDPPVPRELLYDLTQYTYLEQRLLVQKSMEISARLKGRLGPEVLLYLYLLSLRSDLSNENVQLISLIMQNCFPESDVPARFDAEKRRQYAEMERALKLAQERAPLESSPAPGAVGTGDFGRDSASALMDKYYVEEEPKRPRRPAKRGGPAPTSPPSPARAAEPQPAREAARTPELPSSWPAATAPQAAEPSRSPDAAGQQPGRPTAPSPGQRPTRRPAEATEQPPPRPAAPAAASPPGVRLPVTPPARPFPGVPEPAPPRPATRGDQPPKRQAAPEKGPSPTRQAAWVDEVPQARQVDWPDELPPVAPEAPTGERGPAEPDTPRDAQRPAPANAPSSAEAPDAGRRAGPRTPPGRARRAEGTAERRPRRGARPAARAPSASPAPAARASSASPAPAAPAPAARAPAATAPSAPPAPAGARRPAVRGSSRPARPLLLGPFLLAVLVTCALLLAVVLPRSGQGPRPAAPHGAPTPAPLVRPAPPATGPGPAAPAERTYVVRPGDSLWKIFHALSPDERGGASWRDFLSTTRSANDLHDPDLIRPGSVLSITPRER